MARKFSLSSPALLSSASQIFCSDVALLPETSHACVVFLPAYVMVTLDKKPLVESWPRCGKLKREKNKKPIFPNQKIETNSLSHFPCPWITGTYWPHKDTNSGKIFWTFTTVPIALYLGKLWDKWWALSSCPTSQRAEWHFLCGETFILDLTRVFLLICVLFVLDFVVFTF